MRSSQYAAGFAALLLTHAAHAALTKFVPPSQTVQAGQSLTVSDLSAGEIFSAFNLDVLHDPAILYATGVTFGALLGSPDPGDLVKFMDVAESTLLSDAELAALQADTDSIPLATLPLRLALVRSRLGRWSRNN